MIENSSPPRAASFASYISSSTPLKSKPHLTRASFQSPIVDRTDSSITGDGGSSENVDSSNCVHKATNRPVDEKDKRRTAIARRSSIMMRTPALDSPRTTVHARRSLRSRQPSVSRYRLTLPADLAKEDTPPAPPAVEEDGLTHTQVHKKSPKRSRSDLGESKQVTVNGAKTAVTQTAAEDGGEDSRPAKRPSPPREKAVALVSTSPKRMMR